ncbi:MULTISPECIES: CaiB/BaiF CoA-transferase family protein [unclassified Variovorax]|nr:MULTISPECIES: CaiB/BaiF CoA-transferase family protein [unclassified Variovorax]
MKSLPLSGIKVLDLTRALSGPFCTMILADLGADVIKVEPAPHGDMIRQWGPFKDGESIYYLSGNRNKRSLALNFRDPSCKETLLKMIESSDVVVENFRPGVVENIGISEQIARAINPRLIWTSITGYGSKGPKATWPGFDQIAQGEAGFMSFTGTPSSGPQRVGVAIGDLTSGMWAALGVIAALYQRSSTGSGQRVETSLLESLVGLLSVQGQRYLSAGEVPQLSGNVHPVISPYGAFQAKDGLLNIGAATQQQWEKLARLLSLEPLIKDDKFLDNAARITNRNELKTLIEDRLDQKQRAEWIPDMVALGIPAGAINDIQAVFEDEQVKATGIIEEIHHPVLGKIRQVGSPIRMDALKAGSIHRAPPILGQHSEEILGEFGYTAGEIEHLLRSGAIVQSDVDAVVST